MARFVFALCSAALLSACGSSGPPNEAKELAGQLTGDAKGAASDNELCRLYTPDELTKYLGRTPGAGENAMMGCQWSATQDSDPDPVFVQMQLTPEAGGMGENAVPRGAPEYREVPELGRVGYVARGMANGWDAGAFIGKEWLGVSITGPSATDAKAIALFKDVVARRGMK